MSPLAYAGLMAAAAIMLLGVFNLFGVDGLAEAAAATLVR
jgi:NADH-quinone oxidoreductase subunit N